jgi:mono/diheme cytochrome c family protein
MAAASAVRASVLLIGATGLAWISGCLNTVRSDKIQTRTHGEILYEMNCKPCHEGKNLQLVKQPPNLAGLFLHSTLPSGAPANDETVRKTIMEGRGIMPPFRERFSAQDMNDLIQYLHAMDKGASGNSNRAGH